MVADEDLADVKNHQVEIVREIAAAEDVFSAIAVERLGCPHPLAHYAEHLLQMVVLCLVVCALDGVVCNSLFNIVSRFFFSFLGCCFCRGFLMKYLFASSYSVS